MSTSVDHKYVKYSITQLITYTKGFPTQRKNEINNFVGSIVLYEEKLKEECPIECRPKEHLNWTYC